MADPVTLQREFNRMFQDHPRYRLPRGAVWNMQDFLPDVGATLRKRGGTVNYSASISAAASSAAYVTQLVYAPFASGDKLIATTDNSKVVSIATSASDSNTVTLVTATGTSPKSHLVFYDDLVIFPSPDGSTANSVKSWDGTTYQTLAGSPPLGKFATVWKDRLYLGPTAAQPRYIYVSDPSNPTAWDTTNRWFSTSQNITGVAPLPNAFMVFMEKSTMRVRGGVPPGGGAPGQSDFVYDDPIFNVGCTDMRSVVVNGPHAVFANPTGVWLTNGTNIPEDLTETCGVKRLWQSQLSGYSSTTWTLAGGLYQNMYIVTVMNASSFVDTFVFDLRRRHAWRFTNIKVIAYDNATRVKEELFAASRSTDRVLSLSSLWSPTGTVKNDADSTAITPVVETPFYFVPSSKKRWKYLHTHYDLRDAASDNPVLTASYILNPDDAYTALTPTLAESTTHEYAKIPLRVKGHGLALKYAQTNASSDTRISAVMADVRDRENSRYQ